ncbi:MAG: trypsin-like serine protease [Myxococcales bacterium]|nr:trypsin-like serine protease [Myxococcales bacterium]
MRKGIQFWALIVVVGGMAGDSALAITNGAPDGDGHPNVGTPFFTYRGFTTQGPATINYNICTGTLIAEDVLLTAGHCFIGSSGTSPNNLWVSFDPDFTTQVVDSTPPADPTPNEPRVRVSGILVDPGFTNASLGVNEQNADSAVLFLDLNTVVGGPLPAPAALPTEGMLAEMRDKNGLHGQRFTAVGYGSTVIFGDGKPYFPDPFERRAAESEYLAMTPGYLVLSMNPNTGDGGTCYGDSGGPNFLRLEDGTEVLAATTIQGDAVCRATNVVYRLDTERARMFLGSVMGDALP